jgi:hypothetical protein
MNSNESFDRTASHMADEYVAHNEPVAWISVLGIDHIGQKFTDVRVSLTKTDVADIPLYTHPAKTQDAISIQQALEYEKAFEEGRQLGMLQERALWNLTESTQEIENSHPADLTDEEIVSLINKHIDYVPDGDGMKVVGVMDLCRAILKKASEK